MASQARVPVDMPPIVEVLAFSLLTRVGSKLRVQH